MKKYSWQLDNFDSEVFGFKTAKIIDVEIGGIKGLIKDFVKNKIKYATYRIQCNDFPIIHALEKSGFILIDGLISLDINVSNVEMRKPANEIREAKENDINELKKLTSGLYWPSRVFNDPLIPENKAKEFYMKWVENSLLGQADDLVLVWQEEKEIRGYITLQKKGKIPLIGVSSVYRGRGIGKKLIETSLNKFKEWRTGTIKVETQTGNIPALRFYQNCGFKIVNSFLTLRWAKV